MKLKQKDFKKIREALARTYQEKEKGVMHNLQVAGVMSHVRRLGLPQTRAGYVDFFEPFVWKLAPVACALVLILAAVVFQTDFLADYEMAKVLMEDPLESSMVQIING
jgi:hypothetical protein